ncbi:cytochrome P450 [Nocardia sp. NPDC056000]|uniref:cytochrome P450 n=1 Tax=Nocardia sp. NPDC056000 TaxID=3345674 RepID=UPI0035DECB95
MTAQSESYRTEPRLDSRGRQLLPPSPPSAWATFIRLGLSGIRAVGFTDSDRESARLRQSGHMVTGPGLYLKPRFRFLTKRVSEGLNGTEIALNSAQIVREFYSYPKEMIDHEIVKDPYIRFVLGTYSPFLLDGQLHVATRRAITPELTQSAVEQYRDMSIEVLDRIIDDMPLGEPVSSQAMFYRFTQEIILRVLFGLTDQAEIDTEVGHLNKLVRRLSDSYLRFYPMSAVLLLTQPHSKRFGRRSQDWMPYFRRRTDALITRKIAEFRAHPNEDSMAARIIKARLDQPEWTDKRFGDLFRTMLFAGHETSVSAYSWAVDLLAHNTTEREKLIAEARAGETDVYAQACNNETLRLRPPFWGFGGIPREDISLNGYHVRAGTYSMIVSSAVHYDPNTYPSPYEFRPERFLDMTPDRNGFVPFGVGRHRCPGLNFYMIEANIVLHRIFGRLDLRPAGPPDRAYVALGALTRPAGGVKVIIDHRRPAAEVPCYRAKTSEDRARIAAMRAPLPEDFPADHVPTGREKHSPADASVDPGVCPYNGAKG